MAPPGSVVFKGHTSFAEPSMINEKQFSMLNHNQSFNVAVAGDFGCGKNANKTVSNMLTKQPEIVIALGDLSYNKLPDCWFDLFSPLDTDQRIRIAIGDNEIFPYKYTKYLEHFNMTKPYYSFDYNNAHFLAMATAKNKAIPYLPGSDQYKFVNQDLKRAHSDKNVKWIIVFQFRTFYSSNTTHPGLDELQDTYHPLFEKYGVDLVITSHNHNYQRSYPLAYNIQHSRQPIIKDANATQYFMPGVPIYVGVGTAGNSLYDFRGQAPFMVTQFRENGFLHVNITDNKNQDMLTGTFHNIGNGTLDDQFVITKSKTD